jgi:hypothetical protein
MIAMTKPAVAWKAAIAAAVGFTGMAAYQFALAAGAPFGEAAWGGGNEGQLPSSLRVGSGISILVYAMAAAVILRRGGLTVTWLPLTVARIASWVLVVLLTVGALANFASQSPWERFLLGPATLVLAGLCLVVARSAQDTSEPSR